MINFEALASFIEHNPGNITGILGNARRGLGARDMADAQRKIDFQKVLDAYKAETKQPGGVNNNKKGIAASSQKGLSEKSVNNAQEIDALSEMGGKNEIKEALLNDPALYEYINAFFMQLYALGALDKGLLASLDLKIVEPEMATGFSQGQLAELLSRLYIETGADVAGMSEKLLSEAKDIGIVAADIESGAEAVLQKRLAALFQSAKEIAVKEGRVVSKGQDGVLSTTEPSEMATPENKGPGISERPMVEVSDPKNTDSIIGKAGQGAEFVAESNAERFDGRLPAQGDLGRKIQPDALIDHSAARVDAQRPFMMNAVIGAESREAASSSVIDRQIVIQITENINVAVIMKRIPGGLKVALNPPELGYVDISLKDGVDGLHIKVFAENKAVASVIERHIEGIRESVSHYGKVSHIEISGAADTKDEPALGDGGNQRNKWQWEEARNNGRNSSGFASFLEPEDNLGLDAVI